MVVIGIDLGTTNSLAVAYRDDQKGVEMIPNSFGEYLTPSVVSLDGDQVIVGKVAKERLVTRPDRTAQLFKPRMGQRYHFHLGEKSYTPEELSAVVLKQLVMDAESYLGEKVDELVISVPAYFNSEQRQATKRAGELIGLKVDRLINEPSAAAIACRNWNNQHHPKDFESFIVFDLGGGTLDVSVVDCFDNVISIVSIAGDNHLGGSDFDRAIASFAALDLGLEFDSLSLQEQRSLLLEAERAKIRLQDNQETSLYFKGKQVILSRELVTQISSTLLERMQQVLRRALMESDMDASEIDSVIMVGGSSYSPIVRDYLVNTLKLPIIQKEHLDYLVAEGLGTYIGIKERFLQVKDLVVTDICPFSLSTGVMNEQDPSQPLASVLIPRNSVLPNSHTKYYITQPNSPFVEIDVRQGEALFAEDNLLLGKYTIDLPKREVGFELSVTYSYDINSLLYVEIVIPELNQRHTLILGDDRTLIPVEDREELNKLKELSFNLSQLDAEMAVLEYAQRLYGEAPHHLKGYLEKLILDFKARMKAHQYEMKKKRDLADKMNEILQHVEAHMNHQLSDFFQDPGEFTLPDEER